ncbi:MAG: hypothetical protein KBT21_08690 [Treponema sp.]|nr:hypothetical protein [Candidatus Treponema merdequi]
MKKRKRLKITESTLQKIKDFQNEYELYKIIYEEQGATDEVMEYAYSVLVKARLVEYSLCGTVYDRLIKINKHLENHNCVTAYAMNKMFPWGYFRDALLEFCGLKRLDNNTYVSTEENLIEKIMRYGNE